MKRIALIHAVYVAIEPVKSAFQRVWPQAHCVNLIDDALPADLDRIGYIDDGITQRIQGLTGLAVDAGADGVLFTCSAFGSAIAQAARGCSVPVLKPNEAMFEAALDQGKRIGMLATFAPSIPSMEKEFREIAAARGMDASLESFCVPNAMDAAKHGDIDRHNRLVAEAASRLEGFDAVLLAHFSTSTALDAVQNVLSCPVMSAPDAAVRHLKQACAS
jgi:aspartate/glutamate racemase